MFHNPLPFLIAEAYYTDNLNSPSSTVTIPIQNRQEVRVASEGTLSRHRGRKRKYPPNAYTEFQ